MVDLGDWAVPDKLKQNEEFLYWLKARSYRLKAKRIVNKIIFGEKENNYTVKGYKSLLLMAGSSKEESDLAGAKLYMARKNA